MLDVELTGYTPGALGRIVELHGSYYARHWQLGLYFEAKVASEVAEFLQRFDPAHDGAWFAKVRENVIGGIFIDGKEAESKGARLRWFIIDPDYQGGGLGKLLLQHAMTFCQQQKFKRVYLTTFAGLKSARHLYEQVGFTLHHEENGSHLTGSASLVEQVFEFIPAEVALPEKRSNSVISI
jgi:GNAT superfamily N-acetyltransferase